MSKMMVKVGDEWVPMAGLKGDTGLLPEDGSIPDSALVTDGAKTNAAYLMGNRLIKDAEGEFMSVEDSYAVPPVSLSAEGKSTQVTTTGKNLLDPVVDYTVGRWLRRRLSSNGYGTVISSGGTTCAIFLVPLEDGQSLTYSRNTGLKPGFHYVWTTDGALEVDSVITNIVTLTNYSRRTFTNNTGDTIYVGVTSSVNAAVITNIGYIAMAQAQLEYATEFTSYEPYSGGKASPRPDWPQEIVSIDDLKVCHFGRNTIDQTTIEQGSVSSACLDTETTTRCRIPESVFMGFLNGVTVVCTGNCLAGDFEYAILGMRNSINVTTGWLSSGASYTVPNDITSIRMIFRSANDAEVTPEDFSNIQLEVGSSASQYEPCVGNVATIDLSDTPLRSLPDGTKDELHLTYLRPSDRPGWAWYERKLTTKLYEQNVSGFGQFHANTAGHPRVRASVTSAAKVGASHSRCNRFRYNSSTYNYGVPGDYYISGSYAYFILPDEITSIDAANAWLSEHPVTILRDTTPETITLDPIELPAMQSGLTNIWSDPSTSLSVTYERDRNIVISNLRDAVADLATN